AGGTLVQARFAQATSVADVRAALVRPDLKEVVVQDVGGGGREVQIRGLGGGGGAGMSEPGSVESRLRGGLGESAEAVVRVERVGPKVGKDLWRQATLAVLFATLMMGTYIAFRFDLRFGVGAAVALIHDVLFTVAALSVAHMEFDLTTVAGLLTVVGFSVHDT